MSDVTDGRPASSDLAVTAPGGGVSGAVTGALLGASVLVVSAAYDPRLYAANWVPRVALVYPLIAVAALVWLTSARRRRDWRGDAVDVAVTVFCGWQVVAAVAAPVPLLAWLGAYNRTGGAVWWLAMGLALVVARRAFARCAALVAFVWVVAATLVLAAVVALVQAFDGDAWWERGEFSVGRMPGPTGNPVSLGGLGLLALLVGALALSPGVLGRRTRWAAAAGTAAGLMAVVLSVSRAAYLGLVVGGVALAVVWGVRRRRRALLWLAAAAAATTLVTVVYAPGGSGGLLFARINHQALAGGAVAGQVDVKRIAFWRVALEAARERPLAGYGPGGYVVAYRRFVPADVIERAPTTAVTDPHGLGFLLASGSGVVGLLLAGCLFACVALVALRAPPPDAAGGRGGRTSGPPGFADGPAAAAAAYGLAALAFLVVSPAEPAVVLPLALSAGMASVPGELPSWSLGRRWRAVVWTASVIVLAAAGLAGVFLGAALWRADAAYRAAVDSGERALAEAAASRAPWVSLYQVIAGKLALQAAFDADGDAGLVAGGEAHLRRALELEPSDPSPRVDLAKLALRRGDVDGAMREVRAGLEYAPRHPVLQAVWGLAAVMAARGEVGTGRADELRAGLETYPDKVADAWYWLSLAAAARGDDAGAAAAAAEACRRAPGLTPDDYERRLRGGV